MTHVEMDDLYELYVLRVLEPSLVLEIDEHLQTQCEYCWSHIQEARRTTASLAALAGAHSAPTAVRARVLRAIDEAPAISEQPPRSRRTPLWIALAASLVLASFAGWQTWQLQSQKDRSEALSKDLQGARAQTVAAEQDGTQAIRTQAATLSEQIQAAQTQADALRTQINASRQQLAQTNAALTTSRSEADGLRTQTETVNQQLTATQNELRTTSANVTTLQSRLTAAEADRNDVRSQLENVRSELTRLTAERNTLQTAVQILNRPRTRTVAFGSNETDPHGRVLVDQSGGVVFLASALPTVASGRAMELWIVPKNGSPVPVGLLSRDANGASSKVLPRSVDVSQIKALAVSDEPASGSAAPTTKPFLLVPLV